MKKIAFISAIFGIISSASAQLTVGNVASWNVGNGQFNGAFVIDSSLSGVELGLRAQDRFNGLYPGQPVMESGNWVFNVPTGPGTPASYALWNFDFSVLGVLPTGSSSVLVYDTDPSAGTAWKEMPLSAFGLSQDSWNMGMGFLQTAIAPPSTFDPNTAGTYDFKLEVRDQTGSVQASTQMRVRAGTVPDGGASFALMGLALSGLVGFRRLSR